jgi:hypothetical protein
MYDNLSGNSHTYYDFFVENSFQFSSLIRKYTKYFLRLKTRFIVVNISEERDL